MDHQDLRQRGHRDLSLRLLLVGGPRVTTSGSSSPSSPRPPCWPWACPGRSRSAWSLFALGDFWLRALAPGTGRRYRPARLRRGRRPGQPAADGLGLHRAGVLIGARSLPPGCPVDRGARRGGAAAGTLRPAQHRRAQHCGPSPQQLPASPVPAYRRASSTGLPGTGPRCCARSARSPFPRWSRWSSGARRSSRTPGCRTRRSAGLHQRGPRRLGGRHRPPGRLSRPPAWTCRSG